MAHRPDVFNKNSFQESLRRQGCPESFVAPTTSNFRLLVPVILQTLGEEELLKMMDRARAELKLGYQEPAWREAVKYIVGWAEEQLAEYEAQK